MSILSPIRIVLVRPMYGGNLGSVCRAMKNMDIEQLALVRPRDTLDFFEAQKMALSAVDILDGRRQFETLEEAVKDCVRVAGTTVRDGLYRSHSRSMRDWAPDLLEAAEGGPVAIVFGPEDSGLSNEELALCTNLIRIPSSPRYTSLNLAQAVMVCCYELYVAAGRYQAPKEKHPEATMEHRERMIAMWREMLEQIGFFDDGKAEHMMMAFRRIFSRGKLNESDVNILMGVARQAMWAARQAPGGVAPTSEDSGQRT